MVGNITNYDSLDILRVFLRIKGKFSRQDISEATFLGEGSVKNILSSLKKKEILYSSKQGHFFMAKGKFLRGEIFKIISGLKEVRMPLFKGFKGAALLVRNSGKKITYKERDIAIRTGAEAALLFRFDKKLFLPQCEQDLVGTKELEKLFDYTSGDILIVAFAQDSKIVEKALLNVAFALSPPLKKLLDRITNQ